MPIARSTPTPTLPVQQSRSDTVRRSLTTPDAKAMKVCRVHLAHPHPMGLATETSAISKRVLSASGTKRTRALREAFAGVFSTPTCSGTAGQGVADFRPGHLQ